jgi:hypothetical protein
MQSLCSLCVCMCIPPINFRMAKPVFMKLGMYSISWHLNDLKLYCIITNVEDCNLSQCDIDAAQNCCLDSGVIINTGKTGVISFIRNTNSINFITNYVTN